MSTARIRCSGIGKKFCRTTSGALRQALAEPLRRLMARSSLTALRKDEFWALNGVSFEAQPGECIGIIGPNGAGKSTLLKLINGDFRPERGSLDINGAITSLIRLGNGLQPLLTGRENIYIRLSESGFSKTEIDGMLNRIVDFAGLANALDAPVRHYSDGMYARLEFSIATCVAMDILLVDEVLSVGDSAFQMRCLQRLEELKRAGATVLLVSHSEMTVRQIAERCLLLLDGEALAFGETDALFRKYYEATGLLNSQLQPLGLAPEMPADFIGTLNLSDISIVGLAQQETAHLVTGQSVQFIICHAGECSGEVDLVLQFWSSAGLLIASFDSAQNGGEIKLNALGDLRLDVPFLGLTPGVYRVAGGFRSGGRWQCYRSDLMRLVVVQDGLPDYQGLVALPGCIQRLGSA
jgi:ABC-type polysaccharide/polyol phosphate transport system ATPase subunit